MLVRRLIPLMALALGACDKGSESAGEGDADTDADTDSMRHGYRHGHRHRHQMRRVRDYGAAVPDVASAIVDAAAVRSRVR